MDYRMLWSASEPSALQKYHSPGGVNFPRLDQRNIKSFIFPETSRRGLMGLIQAKQVSSCQDIPGLRVKGLGFRVRTKILRHAACRACLPFCKNDLQPKAEAGSQSYVCRRKHRSPATLGVPFWALYNKDYSIWWVYIGSYLWKLQYAESLRRER